MRDEMHSILSSCILRCVRRPIRQIELRLRKSCSRVSQPPSRRRGLWRIRITLIRLSHRQRRIGCTYYGDNYGKLLQIKRTVDPEMRFWNPQAVGVE
jgi:hypothetical protein